MLQKLVVATGISGCGRKEYLKRWEEYAAQKGKKVKVFNVGEMMFEQAREVGLRLNRDNILNADRDLLDVLRAAVFNKIIGEISGSGAANYDAFVLCVHTFFYWQMHYIKAFDKFLSKFPIGLYITFIDSHWNIRERLASRAQWQSEQLSDRKILEWQGVEGEATSGFADIAGKPFYTIPAGEPPAMLYRLIFNPEIETVYTAMPISYLSDPKDRQQIDEFVERVNQHFVVFNPLSVEVLGAVKVEKSGVMNEDNLAVYHHIVYRDLDWLVRRADKFIAIWPQRRPPKDLSEVLREMWPKVIPSPGANHETHSAFTKTKDVWVVCLHDSVSPFITHFATKFFTNTKDFFAFLEKNYKRDK